MALGNGVREARSRSTSVPGTSGPRALAEGHGPALLRMAAQERALNRAALQILAEVDEEGLLQVALGVVSSLLRVDAAALYLTTDDAAVPCCRGTRHRNTTFVLPLEEALPDAFANDVLRRKAPRQRRSWSPPGGQPCGSALAVPLASQGVSLGVLIVGRREAGRFRDDHVSLLLATGRQLAVALLRLRAPPPSGLEDGARDLLDGIAEGLLVVDREMRITYLNPAGGEIIGLSTAQAVGREVGEVLALTDEGGRALTLEAHPFARGLWEDGPVVLTANVARANGRVPLAFSVAPIRDRKGDTACAVGIFRDCSREKEVERHRTEFVSIASHEIRTPLCALQGFTELMLSREIPTNVQRDWLSIMNHEAVRLAALIEEMLDVTRIESGRVTLTMTPVHVGDVVRRATRLFDGEGERVQLVIESAPTVVADGDKVAQVVTNLLRNALDYSPLDRPVTVEIAAHCLAPRHCSLVTVNGGARTGAAHACGSGVSVAIRDQGVGMTREELSRAFQPFYRAESSRKLSPEGSGLGLAIAKAIVERHHGCLWAHSRPGRGSTIGFCLPAHAAARSEGAG